MLCVHDIILIIAILSDIIYRLILIFCPKRYLRAVMRYCKLLMALFVLGLNCLTKWCIIYLFIVFYALKHFVRMDFVCLSIRLFVYRIVFFEFAYIWLKYRCEWRNLSVSKMMQLCFFCIFAGDFPLIIRDCFIRIFIEYNA